MHTVSAVSNYQPNAEIIPEKDIPLEINGGDCSMIRFTDRFLIVYSRHLTPELHYRALSFLQMDYDGNILGNYTIYNSTYNYIIPLTRAITDGRYVYVIMGAYNNVSDYYMVVLKFDPYAGENGSVVDMFEIPKEVDALHNDACIRDIAYYNGYLYLAGDVARKDGDYGGKAYLACMDANTGDILWYIIEENTSNLYEAFSFTSIEIYNDTICLYGGWAEFAFGQTDLLMEARTLNGTLIWRKMWGGPYFDYSMRADEHSSHTMRIINNRIYVASMRGAKPFGQGIINISLTCFTLNGTMLWDKEYYCGHDTLDVFIYNYSNEIYVCGSMEFGSGDASDWDPVIWKYDLNGNLLLCARFRGDSDTSYSSMFILNDTLYLVGRYAFMMVPQQNIVLPEFSYSFMILTLGLLSVLYRRGKVDLTTKLY